jgi:guanylate kinase
MASGKIFVVSAPSGCGKTTVIQKLLRKKRNLVKSVSATTRSMRRGEKDNIDYRFITKGEFKRRIKNGYFLEWERVFENYYGTPLAPAKKILREGKDVVLDLDVKGALHVKRIFRDAVLVFLLPPSVSALKERLKARSTDTPSQIRKRLMLAKWELSQRNKYDYIVLNKDVDKAVGELNSIVKKEREKT